MQPQAQDLKTIVVLIALPEEFTIFNEIFPTKSDVSSSIQVRLEHNFSRPDVRLISVLAQQMGSQSALLSVDQSIIDFCPDLIVILGIAGGITKDLMIGDVAVSNEVIDVLHNTKVTEVTGKSDTSFAPDFYPIDAELVSTFAFLKVHPDLRQIFLDWRTACEHDEDRSLLGEGAREGGPDMLIGPIACGPVVASEKFNRKLQSLHRKVAAIETESGGVLSKTAPARIPTIVLRGISDLADKNKAALEDTSKGRARAFAMRNVCRLLKVQLAHERFIAVAARPRNGKPETTKDLFSKGAFKLSIVSQLDDEIRGRLSDCSPEFKAKPNEFFLPIPRAQRMDYAEEVASKEMELPINIVDCLKRDKRILVRLSRSYPSQSLGLSIAHSLIRQSIDDRTLLPFVITGDHINPPRSGFDRTLPASFTEVSHLPEYARLIIIEEPIFHARNRMRFLNQELKNYDDYVLVITKAEDQAASIDSFVRENGFREYGLTPVSFAETAFFLEKAFDMSAREAEAIAIRLDDTFRKFRLDAHPTYYAGLQEETLAALINANKRAELIQLAVDALLSLIVASDKAKPPLSRTTRERFLRLMVLETARGFNVLDDKRLLEMADEFLSEGLFPTPPLDFLVPFFSSGLLFRSNGIICVTHPYLECYLLAHALREDDHLAKAFFDPDRVDFDYYAFDLYCEIGPTNGVIDAVVAFAERSLNTASSGYPEKHIYLDTKRKMTAMSSRNQLRSLTSGLVERAERLESNDDGDAQVRSEKQRLLDAKQYVRTQVRQRDAKQQDAGSLPDEIRTEFAVLDQLSKALALTSTAVGAGSESLSGVDKIRLGTLVLSVAERFSDIWTQNRMRIDFGGLRGEVLSDENVWKVVHDLGALDDDFDKVKSDLQVLIFGFELNAVLEPLGRVLWRIASTAGVPVLLPVLESIKPNGEVQSLIYSAWLLEVNPAKGAFSAKQSLSGFKASNLIRIVFASHSLWRAYWHHYKSDGASYFVQSARTALRPLHLSPTKESLESIEKGPNAIV